MKYSVHVTLSVIVRQFDGARNLDVENQSFFLTPRNNFLNDCNNCLDFLFFIFTVSLRFFHKIYIHSIIHRRNQDFMSEKIK